MGHSYTDLLVHAVFATKGRRPLISSDFSDRMYEYIGGIARAEKCSLLSGGGMPDHAHLFLRMHPSMSIADLLRIIKSRSTGWIHETLGHDFAWQAGYGAFSVSQSSKEAVEKYIEHQPEHHRKLTFQEEFIALLEKHGIEYDPRYIWS
jgi:putative transposase